MSPQVRRLLQGSMALEEGAESHYAEYVRGARRAGPTSDNARQVAAPRL